MSEYTPTTERVLAYIRGNAVMAGASAEQAQAAAAEWLAEVERAASEKAWGEGYDAGRGARRYFPNPYRREEKHSE